MRDRLVYYVGPSFFGRFISKSNHQVWAWGRGVGCSVTRKEGEEEEAKSSS